jgi:hypothetical protein
VALVPDDQPVWHAGVVLSGRVRGPAPYAVVAALAVVLMGCGSTAAGPAGPGSPAAPDPTRSAPAATTSATPGPRSPGVGPVPTSTPAVDPPDADFPAPHPAFAEHFADPMYHDAGDELAPFGSDEGFDLLFTWKEKARDLTACTTVRSVFEGDDPAAAGGIDRTSDDDPAQDGAIVGAGFTLIFFTGHIDPEGKRLVMDAIRREARYYRNGRIREFPVMLRDLESFPASVCTPSAAAS